MHLGTGAVLIGFIPLTFHFLHELYENQNVVLSISQAMNCEEWTAFQGPKMGISLALVTCGLAALLMEHVTQRSRKQPGKQNET